MEARKIAVIGAGLCGLTAARRLADAGHRVKVMDKGRGTGGRLATRRSARGSFDHGAPYIQAETDAFASALRTLGVRTAGQGFVSTPGMSSLVKPLAAGLDIATSTEIASVRREFGQWILTDVGGRRHGPFDIVIITVPAPQVPKLLKTEAHGIADRAARVRMLPVWTCMIAFAERLDLPDTLTGAAPVERADRCNAKPGHDEGSERWVVHFNPDFTAENLDRDLDMIAPDLLETFAEATGLDLPRPLHLSAHRWRYAYVDEPLGEPVLSDPDRGLFVGGDWTLGPRAEHAWQSGTALSDAVAAMAVAAQ